MKKETWIMLVLILALIGLSLFNFLKTSGSKWECFAQTCTEYATGSEWVKQNCNLNSQNKMICDFYLYTQSDLQKQRFVIPLENINVSEMVSCKTYSCSSEVLVKQSK